MDALMEPEVEPFRVGRDTICEHPFHLVEKSSQRVPVSIRHRHSRAFGGKARDHPKEAVVIDDVFATQLGDEGAPVRDVLDEAFLMEGDQRFTNRHPTHAELARQTVLIDALAGQNSGSEYASPYLVRNGVTQRYTPSVAPL